MPITENLSWKVVLVVLAMGAVGFAIPTPSQGVALPLYYKNDLGILYA